MEQLTTTSELSEAEDVMQLKILKLLRKRCNTLGLARKDLDAKATSLARIAVAKGYVDAQVKDKGVEDGVIFLAQDGGKVFAKVYTLDELDATKSPDEEEHKEDEEDGEEEEEEYGEDSPLEINKENRHKEKLIFEWIGQQFAAVQELYEDSEAEYGVLISPAAFKSCETLKEYISPHVPGPLIIRVTSSLNSWEDLFLIPEGTNFGLALPHNILEASIRVLVAGGDDLTGENIVIKNGGQEAKIVDLLYTSQRGGFLSFQDIIRMKRTFNPFKIKTLSGDQMEVFKSNRGVAKNILEILTFQQVITSDKETGQPMTNGRSINFRPVFVALSEICKQPNADVEVSQIINNIAQQLYSELNSVEVIDTENKPLMFKFHLLKNIRDLNLLYSDLFKTDLLNQGISTQIETLLNSKLNITTDFDDAAPESEEEIYSEQSHESEEEEESEEEVEKDYAEPESPHIKVSEEKTETEKKSEEETEEESEHEIYAITQVRSTDSIASKVTAKSQATPQITIESPVLFFR